MNKYCKTEVRECTLLRSRFAKACTLFDESSFIDAACTLKLRVINPGHLMKRCDY